MRRASTSIRIAALVVGAAALLAACSSSSDTSSVATTTAPTTASLSGTIIVSAAASLTGTFNDLSTSFEKLHPGTTVKPNYGSSAALVTQIQQGAAADVFASASKATMDTLVQSGNVQGSPVIFAQNKLEIVVKKGNPLGINSLADLSKAKTVALCTQTAPCGAAAAQAFTQDKITIPESQVTRGTDVKSTLSAVTNGDADAAVVYVTDANTIGNTATAVPIAAADNVVATYEIATVKGTKEAAVAQAWIAYVTGPVGQTVLRKAGFLPPPGSS